MNLLDTFGNLKVSKPLEKTCFKRIFLKSCALYPLQYFSVSENHVKDGDTVSRRNGKNLNQIKMHKLSKRELNILKIISIRIHCLENNIFFILFNFLNSSVMIINYAEPIFYTIFSVIFCLAAIYSRCE